MSQLIGIVIYVVIIVLAYQDSRTLIGRGVVRPFGWGWAFLLSPYLYLIGRTVVVYRRSARGRTPMVVAAAIWAVSIVINIALLQAALSVVSDLVG